MGARPAVLAGSHPGGAGTWLAWIATSGARALVATVGLVAVILLVRRAERSV